MIPHATTSEAVCAAAVDVGIKQGKTVIAVKDVPGFYVNRCIGPMATETLACVQQGVDPVALNTALMEFGYPVGPVSLLDEVGIDVTTHVLNNLTGEQPRYLGLRMEGADLGIMEDFVNAGLLGKKAGKGFFDHKAKVHKGQLTLTQAHRRTLTLTLPFPTITLTLTRPPHPYGCRWPRAKTAPIALHLILRLLRQRLRVARPWTHAPSLEPTMQTRCAHTAPWYPTVTQPLSLVVLPQRG